MYFRALRDEQFGQDKRKKRSQSLVTASVHHVYCAWVQGIR
jgi:hypothetical protein